MPCATSKPPQEPLEPTWPKQSMQGLGLWPGWLSTEPWGGLSPPAGHCCCSPPGSDGAWAGAGAGGWDGLPVAGAGGWAGAAEGRAGAGASCRPYRAVRGLAGTALGGRGLKQRNHV